MAILACCNRAARVSVVAGLLHAALGGIHASQRTQAFPGRPAARPIPTHAATLLAVTAVILAIVAPRQAASRIVALGPQAWLA